jgi:tellurium resistance protein TerZ
MMGLSAALLIALTSLGLVSLGTIFVAYEGIEIFKKITKWFNEDNKNENGGLFRNPNGISVYGDLSFPYDTKVQVVGSDFQYKDSTVIVNKNEKLFSIDDSGKIEGVTKEDFPLYYSFKEPIINASYLFKDVKFIKMIDLSKMDSSQMVDASSMFENSNVEEIYFASEKDTTSEEYFNTTKIKNVSKIFLNCGNLKKIIFPPIFNVGKNAKEMFKGCSKLKEVNSTAIVSTEIEEIDSMFEDCKSLKEISFSNDFLTGEVKSLNQVFKNTNLTALDISYLRLFNLQTFPNVFSGASINGNLKLGKYYSNNNIRDNLFKEIAKVTNPKTHVYLPSGISLIPIFQNIYYSIKKVNITVSEIYIDYNINYREDENYILYSNYLHVGLGWAYDSTNVYDLDSSVVVFDSDINSLNVVNFMNLRTYDGSISLSGDDLTGEGSGIGDDEEIRIRLDRLSSDSKILTVQINSYNRNILKNVKSAYIRLSTETDVIGTYSITQAGDNIGLLIGCFVKTDSNSWVFRPLNKVIPGHIVTDSIPSIQEILHSIFDNK